MGNTSSTSIAKNEEDVTDFLIKIDNLAAKFVTSSNISNNSKISDLNFCNDLVIMTSDVMADKLTSMDIEFLQQRTEKGIVVDKMSTDKVIFLKKNQADHLDVKNMTQKRRICNGISKFYVKIAQLYAAILKTINPMIEYKDEEGKKHHVPITEKGSLPPHTSYSTQINVCNRRLNALLNGQNYADADNKDVFVHPDICSMNVDANGNQKNITSEEGMVEFAELFKDVYNFDIGKFDKMSDTMQTRYNAALNRFYHAYTGKKGKVPEDIKRFSDIKLRHFGKIQCKPGGVFTKTYRGTTSEKLFEQYALHLKEMYLKTNEKQKDIVDVLKKVFSIVKVSSGEKVIINPTLTYKILEELIKETQEKITTMYVECEEDFLKGIQIFQEIIVHQTEQLNDEKEKHLKEDLENTLAVKEITDEVSEIQPEFKEEKEPELNTNTN